MVEWIELAALSNMLKNLKEPQITYYFALKLRKWNCCDSFNSAIYLNKKINLSDDFFVEPMVVYTSICQLILPTVEFCY